MSRRLLVGAAAGLVLAAATGAASGSSERVSATLAIDARFAATYRSGADCPPGAPADAGCYAFTGSAVVRGLGAVTERYVKAVNRDYFDDDLCVRQLPETVVRVAGKGELHLSRMGPECQKPAPSEARYGYTITGGTGVYEGAAGELRIHTSVVPTGFGVGKATDVWTGTLTVPGLEFDLTAPVVRGAVSKTVVAPATASRARVRYILAAQDMVDGARPVACAPRSGSLFRVGVTTVTCTASDLSGNVRRARFTVTVRR